MKFIFTISFFLISTATFAQVTTSVTLSEKHQRQLSQIKSPEKKARMLKLFLKRDSTQQAKAARRAALKQAKRLQLMCFDLRTKEINDIRFKKFIEETLARKEI